LEDLAIPELYQSRYRVVDGNQNTVL